MQNLLTQEDMKQLTDAGTKERMIEVLKSNGIPFFLKATGWPTTTLEAINGTLLGKKQAANQPHKQQRPEQTPGFKLPG